MDTQPAFGFKQLFTHIVGDMAKAICERNGETKLQQFARSQAAVHTIMGFLPRDVIEAMLAGHCVMFHEVITDSIRDTLRGEMDTHRRATRSNIVAMDKAFGNNLERLERYQARPSIGRRDMTEAQPAEAARPASTPRPETPDLAVPTQPKSPETPATETTVIYRPTPESIAACRANPEAMAALDAGDAEAFAQAMGVEQPCEAYLAASAGQMNRADRRASGNRAPTHPRGGDARNSPVNGRHK